MLFIVKKDIYNKLYGEYKIIKASRDNVKWSNYYVNLANGVGNTINQYVPVTK